MVARGFRGDYITWPIVAKMPQGKGERSVTSVLSLCQQLIWRLRTNCVVLTSKFRHFTCLLFYFLYDQVLHFLFIFGILFHEIFRPSDVRTVMIRQTIPRWKTDEEDKLTKMISVCTNNKHRNKTTTNIQLATEDSWNVARCSGDPWQKSDEGGRARGKGERRSSFPSFPSPSPFVRLLNANAGYLEREALNHWKNWGENSLRITRY